MQKTIVAIMLFSALVFFSGCDKIGLPKFNSKKKTKTEQKTEQKTIKKSSTATKTTDKKTTTNNKTSTKPGTIESVMNYGTGYTPLKIKKTKTQQIKDIQNKYNEKLNKAMR